jgi:hypothetical protein
MHERRTTQEDSDALCINNGVRIAMHAQVENSSAFSDHGKRKEMGPIRDREENRVVEEDNDTRWIRGSSPTVLV